MYIWHLFSTAMCKYACLNPTLLCIVKFETSLESPRLAYGVGAGYSSVRHARRVAERYDSDLIVCLNCIVCGWFFPSMSPESCLFQFRFSPGNPRLRFSLFSCPSPHLAASIELWRWPHRSLKHLAVCCHPRSERERGLHRRAVKHGVALPRKISSRVIPMKKSADDDSVDMASWPFLLPHHFEPCPLFSSLWLPFYSWSILMVIWKMLRNGKALLLPRQARGLGEKFDWWGAPWRPGERFFEAARILGNHDAGIPKSPTGHGHQALDKFYWMYILLQLDDIWRIHSENNTYVHSSMGTTPPTIRSRCGWYVPKWGNCFTYLRYMCVALFSQWSNAQVMKLMCSTIPGSSLCGHQITALTAQIRLVLGGQWQWFRNRCISRMNRG